MFDCVRKSLFSVNLYYNLFTLILLNNVTKILICKYLKIGFYNNLFIKFKYIFNFYIYEYFK
jgi:hypothetical protein